ncbi:putative membrane component of transport system [Klebsiella pneumoniae]|uniref:Putative membrane component of transport system n=1 Tax=Klebsiella pneumoniae TaxID=573 RepID=A0A378G0D3_KLEPN|nr:putative membrane component of transport system [Klebsiella pneumoniae]
MLAGMWRQNFAGASSMIFSRHASVAEWVDNILAMGNDRISFSIASYDADVGIASIARGCQVGTLQLEIPNDGDIAATLTFAGLDWATKADDTSYFGTPVDNSGELRYSFKEVTNIKLNGVTAARDSVSIRSISSSTITCKRSAASVTGSAFAGANIPTTFTPSGSVTLSWSKAAWDLYQKTFTGELFPFEFTRIECRGFLPLLLAESAGSC